MQTLTRLTGLTLVMALGFNVFGCIQMQQKTTLFPDGSGKLEMTLALKTSILDKVPGIDEDEIAQSILDPEELEQNFRGFTAFTKPKRKDDDDYLRFSFTGYFKDINKVEIYKKDNSGMQEERVLQTSFKLEKTEEGHVLTIKDESFKDMSDKFGEEKDEPENEFARKLAEKMMEMMKNMMKGLKIEMAVTVPGKIDKATGFLAHKDRTATITVDEKLLFGAMEKDEEAQKKLKSLSGNRVLRWSRNSVDDETVESFRAEMKKAERAWEEYKEKYEREDK